MRRKTFLTELQLVLNKFQASDRPISTTASLWNVRELNGYGYSYFILRKTSALNMEDNMTAFRNTTQILCFANDIRKCSYILKCNVVYFMQNI